MWTTFNDYVIMIYGKTVQSLFNNVFEIGFKTLNNMQLEWQLHSNIQFNHLGCFMSAKYCDFIPE
jgi:hypothetical protein